MASRAPAPDVCLIAAVNSEPILRTNLLASDPIRTGAIHLQQMWGFASAGLAYNEGLDQTTDDVVVFAHQDIYFPSRWFDQLPVWLQRLHKVDPNWAVAGLVGCPPAGTIVGRSWSSGLGFEVDRRVPPGEPATVCSIDELVIILRRASGLRFDPRLPGFHLYGTDLVQQARAAGLGAYVIDMPVVHNSVPVRSLLGSYAGAYRYMKRKWRAVLPIHTPVAVIDRWQHGLWRTEIQLWKRRLRHQRSVSRAASISRPDLIAQRLGYE